MLSNSISIARRYTFSVLILLLLITFIPFLGETYFNTKGEPREALVAVDMLQTGNWILPIGNSTDMPYKPPMLAWCIAILSFINGFVVTEFVSRLPSALAMIAMGLVVYQYTRRSTGQTTTAFFTVLVLATMFEVHRAATNCRVDMLLTAFMVIAIYRMTLCPKVTKRFIDIPSILLLSGAVLTKGPVGMVIPCAIAWIVMLVRHQNTVRATISMVVTGILSLIIPALWYYAAYKQGGAEFLDLVIEENFGRMTGTMSYESHVNPWWYNILTILAGMLPYTLLFLSAPFIIKYSELKKSKIKEWWHQLSDIDQVMIVSALFIFIFYCIPASKRSVYLLPMYPMLAYGVVRYIHILINRPAILKSFAGLLASLPFILIVAFIAIKIKGPFGTNSTLLATQGIFDASFTFKGVLTTIISIAAGVITWKYILKYDALQSIRSAIITLLTVFWSYSAFYQPTILNPKSDRAIVVELVNMYAHQKMAPCWIEPGSMMRMYTINYYLRNKLERVEKPQGETGQLIVAACDYPRLLEMFDKEYRFFVIRDFKHRSCDFKSNIYVVNYQKRNGEQSISHPAADFQPVIK
ncbi:MAG: glycosyltransferase family 39 protein [Muribaculaceae bacterium]|nr:glycosyltransferase family 39 protein [Muribaculaceae bacterium]MDE6644007.1 glycosyltransferase family 39 protein [Muribaculaceae bacterium]